MLSAAELNFATCGAGELPEWLRESSFRIWPLAEAKTLTLRLRGHGVLVKLRERSGVLVGEVCGFQPSVAALGAVRIGELIVFKPAHVFAVGG
ncbi:MAG TPA: hypothetical protein VE756_12815 [Burkholderiales bacterium]|nr:hypothetical protein [Burkholderiales bacterium]